MKKRQQPHIITILVRTLFFSTMLALFGCQTTYYAAMEKIGFEKRDILVDRVEDAREEQQEAKEQFASALDQFIAVTNYDGGDLEKQYKTLKAEYEDSEDKAEDVADRIAAVERVAKDLFAEWQQELGQYTSREMRRTSERQLKETKSRYNKLIKTMKVAQSKIAPVLNAFRDRVLFLKHNLNARAIASLKTQRDQVKSDITALIKDMNKSIEEADRFIKDMK